MKKIILALAATTALAAAMPASAQTGGTNIQVRIDQLQTQLQTDVRSGAITRAEAVPLREQLRQLSQLERQYRQGGFTVQERSALQSRIASLRQGIRLAARSGGNRTDRNERWSDRRDCPPGLERKDNGCMPPGQVGRDGRDGRWGDDDRRDGEWSDRNRDGYDHRDLNRDGRIDEREWRMAEERYDDRNDRDDDGYDRGDDRYDDRDTRRGGVGGVIDNLLGRNTLRVGQSVGANARLGGVPYEYRTQYRDGNGVYYRSDGRAIYQIDARTHTVLRIYGMNG